MTAAVRTPPRSPSAQARRRPYRPAAVSYPTAHTDVQMPADEHAAPAVAEKGPVAPLPVKRLGTADDAAGLGGTADAVAELADAVAAQLVVGIPR